MTDLTVPSVGDLIGEKTYDWGIQCTVELYGPEIMSGPARHLFPMLGDNSERGALGEHRQAGGREAAAWGTSGALVGLRGCASGGAGVGGRACDRAVTVVEFLLARITEDEHNAQTLHEWACVEREVCGCTMPRTLRACEAERQILERLGYAYDGEPSDEGGIRSPAEEDIASIMATVYADHPDYQPSWGWTIPEYGRPA